MRLNAFVVIELLAADDSLDIEYRDNRNYWEKFLVDVNSSINGLDLEIAHLHDEVTGREMLALVRTIASFVLKAFTFLSSLGE